MTYGKIDIYFNMFTENYYGKKNGIFKFEFD